MRIVLTLCWLIILAMALIEFYIGDTYLAIISVACAVYIFILDIDLTIHY